MLENNNDKVYFVDYTKVNTDKNQIKDFFFLIFPFPGMSRGQTNYEESSFVNKLIH